MFAATGVQALPAGGVLARSGKLWHKPWHKPWHKLWHKPWHKLLATPLDPRCFASEIATRAVRGLFAPRMQAT